MTANEFRRIASRLPEAIEGAHGGHPDFRVNGKIFATLGYPDVRYGVVVLSSLDQDLLVRRNPDAFAPVKGAWGKSGSTQVTLSAATRRDVTVALEAAWRRRAPKRLLKEAGPA